MRVPNVGGQNWQQGRTHNTQKREGSHFFKAMTPEGEEISYTFVEHKDWIPMDVKDKWGETVRFFACKECEYDPDNVIIFKPYKWGEIFDTNEQLSKRFPHLSFPMDVELAHVDLSALTDEKRAELNAKYQINSIRQYSKEYFALMKDLQEAGVLSDGNAYQLPPNASNFFFDENGKVTGFAVEYLYRTLGSDMNFLGYTKNALSFVSDNVEDMKTWGRLTDGEQMAVSVYEMNQSIVAAIENIFSGQLQKQA